MFQKPKGTKDLFGLNANIFIMIRNIYFEVCKNFNFNYIETPIFEDANLFKRSVGELSDIVNKEMYVFYDKAAREIALKPEGTAPVIRAIVEHKLYVQPKLEQKYFYFTPTFRYEQPQKGRQRQFYQAGVEYLAPQNPYNDLEVLLLGIEFLKKLKINDYVLKLNSLGTHLERQKYIIALTAYLIKFQNLLEPISMQRLFKNPLRILDDKIESQKSFIKDAPKILDFLNENSKKNFQAILKLLDKLKINYQLDPNLVRGLDYYDDLVFEFVSNSPALGTQTTILAGGRYNSLINELGGPQQSAIGFGCGIERLLEIVLHQNAQENTPKNHFYIASFSESELVENTILISQLRAQGFNVEGSKQIEKLKNAFKNAASQAKYIIFKELNQDPKKIIIKDNFENFKEEVEIKNLVNFVQKLV